jgi:MoaA/NifB/PqqE/SkfB family radical SAM enzyme
MLRVYQEHPEFDAYTLFDTRTGRLTTIDEKAFLHYLPSRYRHLNRPASQPIMRIDTDHATVFTGPTYETHTRFPRRIYFQITRKCNLCCPYCFIKASRDAPHVPTSAIMDVATYFGQNGLMEVRLTGGEPTIHPDFFAIVQKFQEQGVYVSIATNGVLDQQTLEKLAELDNIWLICSVDGNKEVHNKYRPNTFDRIMNNLRYLKDKNPSLRIRLTTVLTRENRKQMYDLGKICQSVGAESITVIPLRPQVRDDAAKELMVTAGEFKQVIEDLVEAKQKLGIRFTTTIETEYADKIYKDPVFRKRSSCAAGREGTNLDYDPRTNHFIVYGCSYSPATDLYADERIRKPFLGGSFPIDHVEDFLPIWLDDSAWTLFRDLSLKADDCLQCYYYHSHYCVGSCPIQNLDYSKINVNEDMLIQLKQQILKTTEWYCYKKVLNGIHART